MLKLDMNRSSSSVIIDRTMATKTKLYAKRLLTDANPIQQNHHLKKSRSNFNNNNKQISGSVSDPSGDDLTNLNWLQDQDLLKKVYAESDSSSSSSMDSMPTPTRSRKPNAQPELSSQPSPPQQQPRNFSPKPPFSYSALIYMAIESSPTRSMMVRDIYKWIIQKYPYFSTAPTGWKNTIRHTLSLRKCFKKRDDGHGSSSDLKGGHWYVDPIYRASLQQQVTRAANAGMRRPIQLPMPIDQILKKPRIQRKIPVAPEPAPASVNFNQILNAYYYKNNPNRRTQLIRMSYSGLEKSQGVAVSMISVNQEPKVYAPVPMLTTTTTTATTTTTNISMATTKNNKNRSSSSSSNKRNKSQKFYCYNLLRDKQNVCCMALPVQYPVATGGFQRSATPMATKQQPAIDIQPMVPVLPVIHPVVRFNKNNEENAHNPANRSSSSLADSDDDDGTLRDGAEALLNFASRSFSLQSHQLIDF